MTSTRAREESERETRPLVASARGRDAGDMARGSAKRRATPLNERPSSSVFERARGALCVVVACAVVGLLFAVTPESTLGRRRWPARAGGARALGVPIDHQIRAQLHIPNFDYKAGRRSLSPQSII